MTTRMTPDDPRHGKVSGHVAGCRESCCRDAKTSYDKRRVWERDNGKPRMIDSTGTIRRIRALQALGHSAQAIAAHAGLPRREYVLQLVRRDQVTQRKADQIRAAYAALSMTVGPSVRSIHHAARNGWPPPLGWDDETIDDPAAKPWTAAPRRQQLAVVDEVAVQRVMDGETLTLTKAERAVLIQRWRRAGRPLNALERQLGANVYRDIREAS